MRSWYAVSLHIECIDILILNILHVQTWIISFPMVEVVQEKTFKSVKIRQKYYPHFIDMCSCNI